MNDNSAEFIRLMKNPLKLRLFLFTKLPSAFFSGVRVRDVSTEHCVVTVPYKWFSQNPFRSTYFACLSMAAEMSTGALAMTHTYKRNPSISMLVVRVDAEYIKLARERSTFTCDNGNDFKRAIEESIQTGEARTVTATSIGRNKAGEEIARFSITWSFKAKSK